MRTRMHLRSAIGIAVVICLLTAGSSSLQSAQTSRLPDQLHGSGILANGYGSLRTFRTLYRRQLDFQ